MPKPSPYPNHPVRVLRALLGFSSAQEFAIFVGVPAETIRNAEQGRPGNRGISKTLATQIGVATGVSPDWLMSGLETKVPPVDVFSEPVTKEGFEKFRGLKARLNCDPNSPEWADRMEEHCFFGTALLRTAARKGRLPQCLYLLRVGLREAARSLGIEQACNSEDIHELNSRFKSTVCFGREGEFEFGDYYDASRLLSASAQFRWNDAFEAGRKSQQSLLDEIDSLREVVEASFAIPKKRPTPPKSSPPPSPSGKATRSKSARPRRA